MTRFARILACFVPVVACLVQAPLLGAPAQFGREPSVGMTIFADADFRGESATLRSDTSDIRKIGMNDKISSFRIARGESWEVCVDKDYKGRCRVFTGDEANLDRIGWNDIITSLRRVKASSTSFNNRPQVRARITLYDRPNFRGASHAVTADVGNLNDFTNRAASVRVDGGVWELCEGSRWSGRCVTIREDVPDLGRLGLMNRITSVRIR